MHSDLENGHIPINDMASTQQAEGPSRFFELREHRNRPNKWTDEQRAFLCVLFRWFKSPRLNRISNADGQLIFMIRFSDRFFVSTDDAKINGTALATYFEQLRLDDHQIWNDICIDTPFTDPDGQYQNIRKIIIKIINFFKLDVMLHDEDHVKPSQKSSRSRSGCGGKRLHAYMDGATDKQLDQSSTSHAPPILASQGFEDSSHQYLSFDPSYDYKDRNGVQITPFRYDPHLSEMNLLSGSIGFRTWSGENHGKNTAIGFQAGEFSGSFIPSPSRNSGLWAKTIFTHLRPLPEPSAWVSIWLTLVPAIHRLLQSDSANLTFVDADYLARDDVSQHPRIYSAKTAISQYRLLSIPYPNGRPYTYNGGTEFIVWQDIERHAIVFTLSRAAFDLHVQENQDLKLVFALKELSQAKNVRKFRKMALKPVLRNARSGTAVGKFLKLVELPRRFVAKTALMIADNWRFVQSNGATTERYLAGVFNGYDDNDGDEGIVHHEQLCANVTPRSISVAAENSTAFDDEDYDDYDASSDGEDADTVMGGTNEAVSVLGQSEDEDYVLVQCEEETPLTPANLLRNSRMKATNPNSLARRGATAVETRLTDPASPPDIIEIVETSGRRAIPQTPNQQFQGRFRSTLFHRHVTAHEERTRRGEDAADTLRKNIRKYTFGHRGCGSSTIVGGSPSSPICLDDDVSGGAQASKSKWSVPSHLEDNQRSPSERDFERQRCWIDQVLNLPSSQSGEHSEERFTF